MKSLLDLMVGFAWRSGNYGHRWRIHVVSMRSSAFLGGSMCQDSASFPNLLRFHMLTIRVILPKNYESGGMKRFFEYMFLLKLC